MTWEEGPDYGRLYRVLARGPGTRTIDLSPLQGAYLPYGVIDVTHVDGNLYALGLHMDGGQGPGIYGQLFCEP